MSTEQELEMKLIADLNGYVFEIPNQQRGYRWRIKNVLELLEDLIEFTDKGAKHYCLQPLAVKANKYDDVTKYEVLDGQQRLTTIYLLFKSLGLPPPYSFKFSRDKDAERMDFLRGEMQENDSSIDYFYISQAYRTFQLCLDSTLDTSSLSLRTKEEKESLSRIRERLCDHNTIDRLKSLLLNHTVNQRVEFIWYLVKTDAHEIFRSLNSGKIELSNADLIKALLLSESTTDCGDKELIASQLANIQQAMQNDRFWFMLQPFEMKRRGNCMEVISNLKNTVDYRSKLMRIDLLFNLVANVLFDNYTTDSLASFRHFYSKRNDLSNLWKETRQLFTRLTDLYNNPDTYHYIGFITYCAREQERDKIYTRLQEWINQSKLRTKDQIITYFKDIIKKKYVNKNPSEIDYEGDSTESIRRCLLLHNVETLLTLYHNKKDDEQLRLQDSYELFPFDLLYRQKWHIEHLASHTDNPLNNREDRLVWLKSFLQDYSYVLTSKADEDLKVKREFTSEQCEDIQNKVSAFEKDNTDATFNALRNYIIELLESNIGSDVVENKHGIGNLVLLDEHTNTSFHNSLYPTKRRIIIEANGNKASEGENLNEAKLVFVPTCTKYAFMKYYNKNVGIVMSAWTQTDYKCYLSDIEQKLSYYIDQSN